MATVDTGDIIVVNAEMTITGSLMENVYALKFVSTVGGASSSQIGTLVRSYMRGLYAAVYPEMTNTTTFDALVVRNLTQDTDVGTYAWDTAFGTSPSTNDILPPACSPVITFPTVRGKTRGRKFFPGFTENAVIASSLLSGTALTRLGNAAAFMLAIQASGGISGMSLQYVVVSQGVGAFATYVPTGANVSNIVGYQTRRKQGRGR